MATTADIGSMTPYRDPRTAFGRQLPVGQATVGTMADFERAAAPAAIDQPVQQPAQPQGRVARAVGAVRSPAVATLGKVGGVAAAAAPEVLDIGKVAANPASSGIDIATQAAEGAGRLASAGASGLAGAKIGAGIGTFIAPGPGTIIGSAIGGLAGAAGGYYAAGEGIKGLRSAVGADPSSPVDRLSTPPAVAARPATWAPGTAGAGRGLVNPPLIGQPQPGANPAGVIQRDGNSYSGANIKAGADIAAPGGALRPQARVSSIETPGVAGYQAQLANIRAIGDAPAFMENGTLAPNPGMTGFGGATLSSEANARFNATQGGGGDRLIEALTRNGSRRSLGEAASLAVHRDTAARGQDIGLVGQQVAAGTQRDVAGSHAQVTARGQDIGAGVQRDVANIGADARTSAAETAANARAAAAESGAKRYIHMPGGTRIVDTANGPMAVKDPDMVFDTRTGQKVDTQPAQGLQDTPARRAIRDDPKLTREQKIAKLKALDAK